MGLLYLPISWGGARGVNGAAYMIIYGSPMECLGMFLNMSPRKGGLGL